MTQDAWFVFISCLEGNQNYFYYVLQNIFTRDNRDWCLAGNFGSPLQISGEFFFKLTSATVSGKEENPGDQQKSVISSPDTAPLVLYGSPCMDTRVCILHRTQRS